MRQNGYFSMSKRFFLHLFILVFMIFTTRVGNALEDWRNFSNWHQIPDENYSDQPYLVKTSDGNMLCTLTTGKGAEGRQGQHVVATISTDKGKTWSPLIDIEPADGPEASWVVPFVTPSGRIYAFYSYNGDDVGHGNPQFALPDGKTKYRADMLGWYCYKYSDDNGRTWSKRYRLPMPAAQCDLGNQWKGKVQVFWGIDKPKITDEGAVIFAFTRLGRYILDNGEGWLYRSDNLLTESDPETIEWKLYPADGKGIRREDFGSIQEEFNIVPLKGENLYCVYRTTKGFPVHCYSTDGGRSWTTPKPMTYTPGGKIIRNPRACPKLWKISNGRYLFWFHNNGAHSFNNEVNHGCRNIVWLTAGTLIEAKMHWSQPEIFCYCPHPLQGCSYPDLLEDDGRFFIASTQKSEARTNEVPLSFLDKLFKQDMLKEVTRQGLMVEVTPNQLKKCKDYYYEAKMTQLPNLSQAESFSVELWLKAPRIFTRTLLSSVNEKGQGFIVRLTTTDTIQIDFGDGVSTFAWPSDPGLLKPNKLHHVVFVVDGGSKVVTVVVDGIVCDGGRSEERHFGWGYFCMNKPLRIDYRIHQEEIASLPKLRAHEIADVCGADTLKVNRHYVQGARIYNRNLMTSEAIGNYRAGLK